MLDYADYDQVRQDILDRTLDAVRTLPPLVNARYTLSVVEPRYEKKVFTKADEKNALLKNGTLAHRLMGSWVVKDTLTGKEFARTKPMTLMHVPHLTSLGTFVHGGVELAVAKQFRLRPGVYVRKTEDGQTEAHINAAPRGGSSFRVFMDPDNAVFYLKHGGNKVPLFPVLRALGYDQDKLKTAWGDDIYRANEQQVNKPHAINWLQRFQTASPPEPSVVERADPETGAEKEAFDFNAPDVRNNLIDHFSRVRLDPSVTQQTLGTGYESVTPDTLVDSTKRILRVARNEDDPDDRDSLEYQTVHDTGDYLAERIKNDQNRVLRALLWRITSKGGRVETVQPSVLDKHVDHLFFNTGLAQCYDAETWVLTRRGFVPWPEVVDDDEFACCVAGKLAYHRPKKVIREAYRGTLYQCRTYGVSYAVTPNHRCAVRTGYGEGYRGYEGLNNPETYRIVSAEKIHGKVSWFCVTLPEYDGQPEDDFVLTWEKERWGSLGQFRAPMKMWARFLGWYISEGYSWHGRVEHRVTIAQNRHIHPNEAADIERVLTALGLHYRYVEQNHSYVIRHKGLCDYLLTLGKSREKRIPRYLFNYGQEVLREFFESYVLGDGCVQPGGHTNMCTASPMLAADLVELIGRLGWTGHWSVRPLNNSRWADSNVVSVHKKAHAVVQSGGAAKNKGLAPWSTAEYNGMVYCAEVPGGLLYVMRNGRAHWSGNSLEEINPHDPFDQNQRVVRLGEGAIESAELVPKEARAVSPSYFGFVDPVRSPASLRVGVDLRLARGVRKGPDNLLYRELIDAKTGKKVLIDQRQAARSVIASPEALSGKDRFVAAIIRSREEGFVDRKDVDYILPSGDDMFSTGANLVPFKNSDKGMRLLMGANYANQALPLLFREAPFVQSKGVKGSVEQEHGRRMGAVVAKGDGVVKGVYGDHIKVAYNDGSVESHELMQNRPFSRKTYLRNIPQVKAGAAVRAGTVLASSNFTDDKGNLALGTNLRVAYLPYHGEVFEDAVVISESAAKKLASEHMLQESIDREADLKIERENYRRLFPGKFSQKQLATIGDNGMVKEGTVLHYGDPIFLAVRSVPPSPRTMGRSQQRNAAVTWQHPFPAEVTAAVTDTAENRNSLHAYIRADLPMQAGDKMSNRHGGKGVVAEVIPDAEMLRDESGRTIDVVLSPTGVLSRTNSAQMLEAQLGKIAERTGEPYVVGGFEDKDLPEWVAAELKRHRLKDTETVHDPRIRRDIPDVFTGNTYFYKLQHTAESKAKARSTGAYTADELPAKGGSSGAKHIGDMELHALLAHGSMQLIKDLKMIKGQRNDDFWRQLKLGETPIMPTVPLVYEKFKGLLAGAGIELREAKDGEHLFAMSNDRVKELTGGRRLQTSESYTEKDMQPIPGGLFDPEATGAGGRGDRWSYIQLPEPMLNPIMEEPIRTVLGLRRQDLQDLLAGRTSYDGKSGAEGLRTLLKRLDLGTLKQQALDTVRSGARSKRDAAVRQYQYLSAFESEGKRPEDFIWDRVPVLPPKYRPIHKVGRLNVVSDPNYLYKAVLDSIQDFDDTQKEKLPPSEVKAARANVYSSLRALVGVADPVQPELVEKGVGGILEQITGRGSPKGSFAQRRLIGTNIDVSGMGVITPDPNLRLNQVGLPENLAWSLYEPFIVRDLVRHGWQATDAAKAVAQKAPGALNALQRVVKERPVIYNRAPTLHKYSILGAWPVLTKGDTFRIHPAVVKPFGADFDGDDQIALVELVMTDPAKISRSDLKSARKDLTVVVAGKTITYREAYEMFQKQAVVTYEDGYCAIVDLSEVPHLPDAEVKRKSRGQIKFHRMPPGVQVLAYDEKEGQPVRADVAGWSEHTGCTTVIVNLQSGLQIYTDDDPRGVYGVLPGTFEFVRRRPAEAAGVLVPRIVRAASPVLRTEADGYSLTPELGYLIGAMAGDGWVGHYEDRPRGLCFCGDMEEVLGRWSECVKAVFGAATHIGRLEQPKVAGKYAASSRLTFTCATKAPQFADWLGRGSDSKHLPPWFVTAPIPCRKAMLEGLLDTDGSVSVCKARAKNKPQLLVMLQSNSLRLIREVQHLARSLSIRGRITATHTPAGKAAWMLNLNNTDVLAAGIALRAPNKRAALKSGVVSNPDSPAAAKSDLVPVTTALAAAAMKAVPYGKEDGYGGLYSGVHVGKKKGFLSRSKARQLIEKFAEKLQAHPDWEQFVRFVERAEVTWDPVVSIEDTGIEEVGYDLTVPGYETFMAADGVVLSNTMSFSVPVSKAAVDEVVSKMMPEKLLLGERQDQPNFVPGNEYLLGLYLASKAPAQKALRRFPSRQAAVQAYRDGKLRIDDPIEIG